MIGNKKEKVEKLVKKGNWEKINSHFIGSNDPEVRLALAEACALSQGDGPFNCLTTLMRDPDAAVQLAAVKSMGKVGSEEHAKAELNWLLSKSPSPELKAAITETLTEIKGRK